MNQQAKQFLLSDVGSDAIGQTKTFVTITPNVAPKGSFNLVVSTTYSKAKDPAAHIKRLSLTLASKDRVHDLADFLVDAVRHIPIND